MSKYEPLKNYLAVRGARGEREASLTFDQLEGILNFALPTSAYRLLQWWENETEPHHPQAKAWIDAGWYCSGKSLVDRRVTFRLQSVAKNMNDHHPDHHLQINERTESASTPATVGRVLVFSPCSSSKSDRVSITPGSRTIRAQDYLDDKELLNRLQSTREDILERCQAVRVSRKTYALDLYTGIVYRSWNTSRGALKQKMLSEDRIHWFFISGGYGVIHALEEANKYAACLSEKDSRSSGDIYTGNIWRKAGLASICDAIVRRFNPSYVYIFGNRDYTTFLKDTEFYAEVNSVRVMKVFEKHVSKRLSDLVQAILDDSLDDFNAKYPKKCYKHE